MYRVFNTAIIIFLFTVSGTAQNYFQQELKYLIDVSLDVQKNSLEGDISIEYKNNSPNTLNYIIFHLWPNAYKSSETALGKQQLEMNNQIIYNNYYDLGYIDSLDFYVDKKKADFLFHEYHSDICTVFLKNPLLPNKSITIETPFFVKIPDSRISRLGHDAKAYQISQWYPKPAVYDMEGWHAMPYLDMGEFYSEFASFDVSITLPENYIVAATGNLQTKSEIDFLESLAEKTRKELPQRNSKIQYRSYKPSEYTKTIRYTENNIHDFAWFADMRFNVSKDSVFLPKSNKFVNTYLFYTAKEAHLWNFAQEYIKDAVYFFSEKTGDYPYKNCSAVENYANAGGGMEYPGITLIGQCYDAETLEQLIVHEVGHNWFYGILANNERKYPWLDEGVTSFYEMLYFIEKYPDKEFTSDYIDYRLANFVNLENLPYNFGSYIFPNLIDRRGDNQALCLHSEELSPVNYFAGIYSKAALNVFHLYNFLGAQEFNRIMKIYYSENEFKHVYPETLKNVFEKHATKNTSWFFNELISTDYLFDYKIKGVKNKLNSSEIIIKNKGLAKPPIPLSFYKNDSLISTMWVDGFSGKRKIAINQNNYDKILLDPNYITADLNRGNNTYNKNLIFKKSRPLALKWIGAYETHETKYLYFTPLIAYNYYDKFMPGLLVYNTFLQQKPLQFFAMPLYSHSRFNEHLSYLHGEAKIVSEFRKPLFFLKNILLKSHYKSYGLSNEQDFHAFTNTAEFSFYAPHREQRYISLSNYNVTDLEQQTYFGNSKQRNFLCLNYVLENKRYKDPYSLSVGLEQSKGFVKSSLTAKYRISWNPLSRGIDFRLFAGKFLYSDSEYYGNYNFRLSGWRGYDDYLYKHIFAGRMEMLPNSYNNALTARQFAMEEGGFTTYSPFSTNRWLVSFHTAANLWLFYVYGSFASYRYSVFSEGLETKRTALEHEIGLEFRIIKNVFSIYFPLIMSKDIEDYIQMTTDNYWQRIRFTLNLTRLNPFEFLKNIDL
jgi:hypothetical protein